MMKPIWVKIEESDLTVPTCLGPGVEEFLSYVTSNLHLHNASHRHRHRQRNTVSFCCRHKRKKGVSKIYV